MTLFDPRLPKLESKSTSKTFLHILSRLEREQSKENLENKSATL
jgi:hypothetical protein